MNILIGFVIYAFIASIIFYIVVFTDKRIFRKRYNFTEAAKRFSLSLIRMNKAMAAMTVSFAEASAALKKFGASFEPMIHEYESKYGPRPTEEPFLEWAIRMEKGGS